uniref:Protein inscuteable homologue C-terminal domain-containing protein n=1 Tax=Anopheles marajoara TaxID=58244 RepID=A0A2M4BBV4_9DIPT
MMSGFRPYAPFHMGTMVRTQYPSFHDLEEEDEELIEEQQQRPDRKSGGTANDWAEANRQGSPSSHKSQDSGFSDTETSPNTGATTGGHSKCSLSESQSPTDQLTPKRTIDDGQQDPFQRSPSLNSEAPTPPTVIRRPAAPVRRGEAEEEDDGDVATAVPHHPNGRRLSYGGPMNDNETGNEQHRGADRTVEVESSQSGATTSPRASSGGSISLKRGRVITKNSRVKRNLNEQLSNSSEEMISLDSSELTNLLNETIHNDGPKTTTTTATEPAAGSWTPKGILKTAGVRMATDSDAQDAFKREGKELPTYSQLYPAGTSTPIKHQSKLYRSLPLSPTHRTQNVVQSTGGPRVVPTRLGAPAGSGVESFYDEPTDHTVSHNSTTANSELHALSYTIYDNPLLNGHMPAVQHWLDGLRFGCQNEVMSILQTKSIAVEAGRTMKMTSGVAVKILRHLQTKVTTLQGAFERVEKLFAAIKRYQTQQQQQQQQDSDERSEDEREEDEKEIYQKVAPFVHGLASDIYEFVVKQKANDYFGRDSSERDDRRKYVENSQSLLDMATDLRIAAANGDGFDYWSVEEEIQIVKRYFLITVRLIFKSLVKVIVDTIENAKCDLILRSNLSYVAMLSNVDYGGLASLNDAFISNYTARALLLVCVESKFSSIRALALRALATVCSTTEAIRQLERADGLEILRDIMVTEQRKPTGRRRHSQYQQQQQPEQDRSEPELREAVSVLTQITAPWHGEDHRLEGLKQHVHSIVEAITEIIEKTTCCQTLLLCAACLNNMTRIEPTAVYSLMSQDTVGKLKAATELRGPGASIFLYEQFTSMLYNMSANWKCHHHLANRTLVAFLVALFNRKFFEKAPNRTESEAQRKTIKNILHVLSRLMSGGSLSTSSSCELIESTIVPVFARLERTLDGGHEHYRDISYISRRLNESLSSRVSPGQHQHHHHHQSVTSPTVEGDGAKDSSSSSPALIDEAPPVARVAAGAPHITRLTIQRDSNGAAVIMLDKNRQESYV